MFLFIVLVIVVLATKFDQILLCVGVGEAGG